MAWLQGRATDSFPHREEHHEHVDRDRLPGREHRGRSRRQGGGAGRRDDHPARCHRRDPQGRRGKYHVTTNHHPVAGGTTWGMFWGLLFGMLFFVPVIGMAVGAGLGALMGKVEKVGIDKQFEQQVKDMVQPGTSALFLVVEHATPDKAVEAMAPFGGTVLKSSLSKDAEKELQDALHGGMAATARRRRPQPRSGSAWGVGLSPGLSSPRCARPRRAHLGDCPAPWRIPGSPAGASASSGPASPAAGSSCPSATRPPARRHACGADLPGRRPAGPGR